ncbi:MAG: endonuclease/exonuclease/phosphatase [Parcubacteria group bacterium Greene0416_79]|nr:MAG: endonuclease/exonuclease/phosphatase [Parcubacteria group bacterium Greene0416_79]
MPPVSEITFISLNIERDWHYDRVIPFLKDIHPDVVCLQEVLDRDVSRFNRELAMQGIYMATSIADKGRGTEALAKEGVRSGNALFSRLPIEESGRTYYCGCSDFAEVVPESSHCHRNLIWAKIIFGNTAYLFATTHFTWTRHGETSNEQRRDLKTLFGNLDRLGAFVLSGDFNAPRGREIWETLATRYKDNIPPQYKTTLDQELHDTPGLQYVVDGLFTTPEYECRDTKLVCGVSDHCAVVSCVERV